MRFRKSLHAIKKKQTPQETVQFSHSVMSDSLRLHGLQHARLLCPSPNPGACPGCQIQAAGGFFRPLRYQQVSFNIKSGETFVLFSLGQLQTRAEYVLRLNRVCSLLLRVISITFCIVPGSLRAPQVVHRVWALPGGKESACQSQRCKRSRWIPGLGLSPVGVKWQPTLVFLAEGFHIQRSLASLQLLF